MTEETDIAEDPALTPDEKQLSLVTTKRGDEFRVHSELTAVTRYLLEHPEADVENTRTVDGTVVACTARIPHGLVKLQGKPRKSNAFSQLVSGGELQSRDGGEKND